MKDIVVVGAGVAGVSAITTLRRRGYDRHLTLVSNEHEFPYNRPPLSKEFLAGVLGEDEIRLASNDLFSALNVDVLYGADSTGIDPDGKILETSAGDLHYDGLILATGAIPMTPRGWPQLAGVHPLRTLDDARAIRNTMQHGSPRVVVVGGGFVGCEVASTARTYGLDTTIVEPCPAPLHQALGPVLAELLARQHRDHGVHLRCGVAASAVRGGTQVEQVELSDGSLLAADLVVVGIGARPAIEWLAGTALGGQDGVLVSSMLQTILPNVYAAGDIARWPKDASGSSRRVEHWTTAHEQGSLAAANLLAPGEARPYTAVPYVWSDQHGTRLQIAGTTDRGELHFEDRADDGFLALLTEGANVSGVIGLNRVREFTRLRRSVTTDLTTVNAGAR